MSEQPKCELCGEPMPPGEEMLKFHGFSGPCPKPPVERLQGVAVVIEYIHRNESGKFHLDVICAGQVWDSLSFDSAEERQTAQADLLSMMRSLGAKTPNRG